VSREIVRDIEGQLAAYMQVKLLASEARTSIQRIMAALFGGGAQLDVEMALDNSEDEDDLDESPLEVVAI
jgi:hypothetical protein